MCANSSQERTSQERCAFCGAAIGPSQEIFGFGVKSRADADVEGLRGHIIDMTVESLGRTVPAIVTTADSPAAQQGFDFYLMTCTETCAARLKDALELDIAGGDAS